MPRKKKAGGQGSGGEGSDGQDKSGRKKRGLSRNEKIILGKLREADRPLKAYEMLELARGDGFTAPMTVYRALRGLIALGLVKKIARLNAFVIVTEEDEKHIDAYLICRRCGRTDARPIERDAFISMLGAEDMPVDDIFIEVFGACAVCAAAPA